MLVAIVAVEDFGNVGWNLASAICAVPGCRAVLVQERVHPFRYPRIRGGGPRVVEGPETRRDAAAALAAADVVIWKDDRPSAGACVPVGPHCLRVVTAEGSGARRDMAQFLAAASWADAVVALTPDLAAAGGLDYLPQVFPFTRPPAPRRELAPRLLHAVGSNRGIKGTDDVLLPAVDLLHRAGLDFELELLHSAPHSVVQAARERATVVFDQANAAIGAYGMFAVESMAAGLPVVGYLSPAAVAAVPPGWWRDCPLHRMGAPTEDAAAALLEPLLRPAAGLGSYAAAVASYQWGSRRHGYAAGGRRWLRYLGTHIT